MESAFFSLINPKSICLSLIVCLILVLSQSMEAAGQMARLLDRFQGLVRAPAANLIVFPALIGLLPMPGGAIFSAPMVKTLGSQYRLSPTRLSYVNYWFRHIWEYWWPLYPGVLLTTTIAGMDLWYYVLFLFPLTPVALMAGYRPLIGDDPTAGGNAAPDPPGADPDPSLRSCSRFSSSSSWGSVWASPWRPFSRRAAWPSPRRRA